MSKNYSYDLIQNVENGMPYSVQATKGNESPANTIVIPLAGDVAEQEGYSDNYATGLVDGLTAQERQKLNSIYSKIKEVCEENKISLELAKSEHLLEKIAGVDTKKLISMSDDKINDLVKILQDNLGWGDGLGFGQKTKEDLDKLVNNIFQKDAFEKTGGNKYGQAWYNIKNGVKNVFGRQTIDKYNTPEEITEYFRANYLQDIDKLSKEEKEQKYAELLREFFYTFNSVKDNNKKVAMTQAIKTLAAQDRAVMVEVIEKYFSNYPEAIESFAKALNDNRVEIVTSTDALGNNVTKTDATNIAHIAYKHMSEEDVKQALETLKKDAQEFYQQYGEQIKELRERVAKGETLTEAEQTLLDKVTLIENNVYVAGYSGAVTGTAENSNIEAAVKTEIISAILNDTQELGIQDEVLQNVSEYIEEHPEVISNTEETVATILSNIKGGNAVAVATETEGETNETIANEGSSVSIAAESNVQNKKSEGDYESIGFAVNTNAAKNTNTPNEKIADLYSQLKAEQINKAVTEEKDTTANQDFVAVIRKGGVEAFHKMINEDGAIKTVAEAFNNKGSVGNDVLAAAENLYKRFTDKQDEILERLSMKGIGVVANITANSTWEKVKDKTFGSFGQTKLIQENAEERLEEKA